MTQIDWSKAPEGATHHLCWAEDGSDGFFGSDAGDRFMDCNNSGEYVCKQHLHWWIVKERPTKAAEWNGTGLPPVGTVCEVTIPANPHPFIKQFDGRRVTITAHDEVNGDPVAVFRVHGLLAHENSSARYHALLAGCFRPIRTPEQIAAEERDKTVNTMVATAGLLDKGWCRKVCAALYDAGYRKVEGGEA